MGGAEKEKTGLKKCTIAPNLTPFLPLGKVPRGECGT